MAKQNQLSSFRGDLRLSGNGWSGVFSGNCPVQGWGHIDGHPFYFRARGQWWEFCVAPIGVDPVDVSCDFAPGFKAFGQYGEAFEAGWMLLTDVSLLAVRSVQRFREALAAREQAKEGR